MVGKKTQKLSHARKKGLNKSAKLTNNKSVKHHNVRKGGDGGGPKHRNCHPQVLGKTVSPNSCMTPLMLEKIKKTYNHAHAANSGKHIISTDAVGIYHELKKKHLCESERCMIKKALGNKHSHLYDQMMKEMEAPEHPDDWKKNPNEWLSNVDIDLVMEQYEKTYPEFLFLGPTSINFDERSSDGGCVGPDKICHLTLAKLMAMKPLKRKVGMVFNLSRNDQPGSHWVSLFLHLPEVASGHERDGVGGLGLESGVEETEMGGLRRDARMGLEMAQIKGCKALLDNKHSVSWNENTPYAFFFDSGGADAPQEVLTMICRFYREWEGMKPVGALSMQYDDNHRTKAEHQMGGTECGMYSLFFIITMLTGICGGKAALLNARRLKKREVCPKDFRLHGEQDKRDYFLSHGKWNHKRIPDRFMQEFRAIYFNAR